MRHKLLAGDLNPARHFSLEPDTILWLVKKQSQEVLPVLPTKLTNLVCCVLQVRLVDWGAQFTANSGIRESVSPVQHWRPLHTNWHQAGHDQINRPGYGSRQLP